MYIHIYIFNFMPLGDNMLRKVLASQDTINC